MAHAASRVLVLLWLAAATVAAYDAALGPRAIQEAIVIGQSRIASTRVQFHEPYRIRVAAAPVDFIEVVTPFRRIVLAAEDRARAGGGLFGQREALQAQAAGGDALELIVELTFHPLNTYVGVPAYAVALLPPTPGAAPIEPDSLERVPRFGPRVEGPVAPSPFPGTALPDGSQPMLGGTIVARFPQRGLNTNGVYEVAIEDGDAPIGRVSVNLGRLR